MRVVVIGAGPAGMSAAIAARGRGHEVTVLEREATVGGKCLSLVHDGRPYDLGANLTTPRYSLVRALGTELGLNLRQMRPRQLRSVDDPGSPRRAPLAAAGPLERALLHGGQGLYVALRELTGVDREGFAGLSAGAREPFHVWLDRHRLTGLRDLFANLFIAYGYGVMDDLPAAYALKFFDPIHLEAAVDVVLGEPVQGTMDWAEGFQELWERADRRFGLGVLRNADVRAVRRSPRGVEVAWSGPEGPREEGFDRVIIACPAAAALAFLADATDDETALLSMVRTNDYYVTAATTSGLPPVSTYVIPYCQHLEPGQPTVFYRPYADDPGSVFLFYAYGAEGVDEASVRANIARVAGRFGGKIESFLTTQHWRYFPHVDAPSMKEGFYDRFEALQGAWHTWWVGEMLSFTLVELSARYAKALVERAF